jgi:hypothetical protein
MTTTTRMLRAARSPALQLAVATAAIALGCRPRRPMTEPAPIKAAALAPAVIPAAPPPEATFDVAEATGTVEAQRAGLWVPLKRGDTLTRSDVLRTAASSTAVLRLATGTEIELRAGVEIAVDRLPGGASVDLRRGKVLARVGGKDALSVTARETRTTNEGPARFVVQADARGKVSVAALEGKAQFSAAGKSVALSAGTASSSQAGAAPEDPERIPEDVLLSVVWPAGEHHGDEAQVSGRAAPSSTVSVNGAPAAVGPDGRFTATIALHEGKNPVEVVAEDLAGRTRHDATTVVKKAAHAPKLTPEATDLWKK